MERSPECPFDPPRQLRDWQRDQRVVRVRLWSGARAWVLLRHADQRAMLSDPRVSANASLPGFPHSLPSTKVIKQGGKVVISLDNPEHDALRRMLARDFMIKKVEARRPHTQRIVDGAIDQMLASDRPVDLVRMLALPVPSLVICDLLGVPPADQEFFQGRSEVIVSADATEDQTRAALSELWTYLGQLADAKAVNPGDDLISRLVERIPTGEMTREDVVTSGVFLLVAGHETTANMIALGTLALLRHPDQLARVRGSDDPSVIANAVEELLRYLHTPHSGRTRIALEDFEIGGQLIRAGDGIIAAGNICDRDPEAFPGNPDELDIGRPARHHTAFGFGIHQCLGQPLARMELQVVYETLLRRIPTLRLAVPFADLRFKVDRFVYGVHALPITW
jgi:hypothetical protein